MSRIKSKSHTGVYREKLLDGDISYYYTYKNSQGKKKWVKVGKKSEGYSERDAVVQRRETMAKTLINNEPLYIQKNRKNSVTVRELAQKYFSEKTEIRNHRDAYLKYCNIIDPEFGHRDIYTVQISEIRDFKDSLSKIYRPASVNYYLAQLKAIINYAISNEVIFCNNPSSSVPLLPLDNNRQRVLNEDEIKTLLTALKHKPKPYLFVLIAILTGARPQAILNLRKKDIEVNLSSMIFMAMKKRPPYSVGVHTRLKSALVLCCQKTVRMHLL
ncbi:MAG: site-specific integrase [Sulfurospirillum sp.]